LIDGDAKREAQRQLESLLLEGLREEETEFARDDWRAIRQEAAIHVKKAPKSNA
jgi:hypothetical protein